MNLGTKSLEATGEGSVSYLAFVKLSDLNTHWLSITAHFTLTALDKRFRTLHARLVRHRLTGSGSSNGDSVNFFGNGNSENAVPVGPVSTGVRHIADQLPNLFSEDYLDTSSGPDGFGSLPGQGNTPRTMEFGLRLNF
jgi:hypothetical protein